MTLRTRWGLRWSGVTAIGLVSVWCGAGDGNPGGAPPAASLLFCKFPGGDVRFALSLRGPASNGPASNGPAAHDHVVLVDTSASQTGAFRDQSRAVLEAALAAFPPGDRVRLMAIDVDVHPLSDGFHAAQGPEAKRALETLERRVPLGATKLARGLRAALEAFSGNRPRSIVYIGDGMSTAGLIEPEVLRKLVADLREVRVAVHSYAIGPRTDLPLLGLLAVHTGGVVLVDAALDDRRQSATDLGRKLAQAADAPILYVDALEIEPAVDALFPTAIPPLRADRDTVLLGAGQLADEVSVTARLTGDPRTLKWKVPAGAGRGGHTFLAGLWNAAERSGGLFVSVAGSELLDMARDEYEEHVQRLAGAGKVALKAGDPNQAERIASSIREVDPLNVDVETILQAAQKIKTTQLRLAHLQNEPARVEPAPEPGTVNDATLLQEYEKLKQVRTERMKKEVDQTIEAARRTAAEGDAGASIQGLKRVLNAVNSSVDVDPPQRDGLRRRIQNMIDRIAAAQQQRAQQQLTAQERLSALQARRLAIDDLQQHEEELEQLIDKVRSLLTEGFSGNETSFEAAESVARVAWESAPYSGVTAAAVFDAEAAGQLDSMQRMIYLRSDKFLKALELVERAHVPFPDEPPILWPPAEVWRDITNRRKKWTSVDITQSPNKMEQKIRASLANPTEVSFAETALEDAIKYLGDYHRINLWIDRATLQDEGVSLETPVTLQLSGVSFRSTLKLLLEPHQLTYLIEDEVMKITTSTKAADRLTTRVDPVGDLVIRPMRLGGGSAGALGGMGMGGGGMGGGMGGMGMGGMGGGMGMMGGGMGMFDVPDDLRDHRPEPH